MIVSPNGSEDFFKFHESFRARLYDDLWRDGVSKLTGHPWFSYERESRVF